MINLAGDISVFLAKLFIKFIINFQIENLNMFTMNNQFAYVVPDTNSRDFDMTQYFSMAKEGFNLAFIYNMSNSQPGANCPGGVTCIAEEIGNILIGGFRPTLRTEMHKFTDYSFEEFELMRDTEEERHTKIVMDMKAYMESSVGKCNNCTKWGMEAVESKDAGRIDILDVGSQESTMRISIANFVL